jgi:hypothetical protein
VFSWMLFQWRRPRWNNLPLLFLYLGVALTSGVEGQVAWSSRRSLDPTRLMSGGWRSALSWVVVLLAAVNCVCCPAAKRMDGSRWRRSSSSTTSDEGDDVWIW